MSMIKTIAFKEVKSAFRNSSFLMITTLFVLLSIISVYIGTSTKNAVLMAFNDSYNLLVSQGATSLPIKPQLYPLSILSNIVTYINMLGAVVSIYLGYEMISGEKSNGTYKLISVKPLYKDQIISGKILGGSIVLLILLSIILVFNLILFMFITSSALSIAETIKLGLYFLLAFTYLFFFFILALYTSIKFKDSEYGFLLLMIIWMIVSFVIPELANTQKNFSYAVNVATQSLSAIPTDTALSNLINLISPATQLQLLGENLLQVVPNSALDSAINILINHSMSIVMIISPAFIFTALTYLSIQKEEDA